MEEYNISLKEIDRRKKAFTTLIVSVFSGIPIFAFDFILTNFFLSLIILFPFSIFLYLSRILTIRALQNYSQIKLFLDENSIERHTLNSNERYSLKDITQINIKRSTKNYIREIKITFNSGVILFVNGLKDFEQFKKRLVYNCQSGIKIKELKEHIDFDHQLFYLFFGLLVSFFVTFLIRWITSLNTSGVLSFYYSIIVFNLMTGLIMIFTKPISGRYGKNTNADYIIGGSILFLDIVMFITILV